MRYLIAGGAGFLGSNLCARLLADGHEVVCIDNLITGRHSNVEGMVSDPGFLFINHNIIEPLPELPQLDGIMHLASPAGSAYRQFGLETMRTNSEGTLRLLQLATAHQAPFVYASSGAVYGNPLEHPQVEEYRGNVSPTGPRSVNEEAKRYGEALVTLWGETVGGDSRVARIFNTYGPHSDPEDGTLVASFITRALRDEPLTVHGDGRQTRSLCYVSDLVEGLAAMLTSPAASGEVTNLGNPEEHSVVEIAELIIQVTCSRSTLQFGASPFDDDPRRRQPDISKARRLLNWEPRISLAHGLLETVEHFRQELRLPAASRS